MAFPKIISFKEAAALIPDNSVVAISSSSGLACPNAMLAAIGAANPQSNSPAPPPCRWPAPGRTRTAA